MMEVSYAKQPVFSSFDRSSVDLIVKFSHLAEEVPFTASRNDPAEHGRELYARAISGEFGKVGPYTGLTPTEQAVADKRQVRNNLLMELDAVVSNPIRWGELSEQEQQELKDYRRSLLDAPNQPGFTQPTFQWPAKPPTLD